MRAALNKQARAQCHLFFVLTGLFAAIVPAMRAAAIAPMNALRHE
jgi:hypothetical protein